MNRTVVWAYLGAATPMGQQKYEIEIQRSIKQVAGKEWSLIECPMTPLRSSGRSGRRFSARIALDGSWRVSRVAGAVSYRTRHVVHRFDLRLPCAVREVLTVHDLPSARFSDEGKVPRSAGEAARRAAAVICPSQFAADELRELLGIERLDVIPYGVAPMFHERKPATSKELEEWGITTPFVLHAAGASARKNLSALAAAWKTVAALLPDVSLALCGPPDARRTAAFSEVPRVNLLGYQPPAAIARLTAASAAVIVPSLYEGFGLPALEGMAAGVPVVAARRGALPEVCGDGALLVEPDADGLAHGIERVLTDTAFAQRLRTSGPGRAAVFSWDAAARAHIEVYKRALG